VKSKVLVMFAGALSLPLGLLAASKNSAGVTLNEPVTVSGTQLKAGDYQLRWEGDSGPVQVSFVQNKKVVATVAANLVQRKTNYDAAIETKKGSDNSSILEAIDWKTRVLVFDQDTSAPVGGTESSPGSN
jgi:hypothetical protein